MSVFYKLLGFGMIGLGFVNLISLLSSLYNPLLGISIIVPVALLIFTWCGVLIWQLTKTEEPKDKSEILSSLAEFFGIFVVLILGVITGVA